ncbi:MAG: hypothetical protein DI563_12420 [Variovorax paradoxus]|uniref:Acyltransferase n=1 Tax=Variovorax paradoxus TaxID=34073 RepID=A0A2W5SHR8_VARPD|nr:MAG: hypothetical protein DI563_12420 [Variovorax paradoxus]
MQFSSRQRLFSGIRKLMFSVLGGNLRFGRNVYIGPGCTLNAIYNLEIGSNVYIGKRVTIEVEGRIGNGVIIGNNVGIVGRRDHWPDSLDQDFFFAKTVREDRRLSLPVDIGDGCWIGYGAIVLSGVRIGERSIVGAGAVVTRDIPPHSVVRAGASVVFHRTPNHHAS